MGRHMTEIELNAQIERLVSEGNHLTISRYRDTMKANLKRGELVCLY